MIKSNLKLPLLSLSVFISTAQYHFVNADELNIHPPTLSAKAGKILKAKKKKIKKKICHKYQVLGQNYGANSKDLDGDFIANNKENSIFNTNPLSQDTDGDTLSDVYEICISHTNPTWIDSDGDGTPDASDPDSDTPNGGDSSTFCDENGNTQGFGIPAGQTGNAGAGESRYSSFCVTCHANNNGFKGAGKLFNELNSALKSAPMNFNLPTQVVADLTAFLNVSNCTSTPPGGDPLPTPTSSPEPSPSSSPTPSSGNCDSSGNTTAFGIPAGLTGNTNTGGTTFHSVCSGCHIVDKGVNFTFTALKQAVMGSPMFIPSLSDQQFADLTAYLNRANCSSSGEPTPSPTPPPTQQELGYQYFISMCSSCHSMNDPEPSWTANKINHAFNDEDEMQDLPWRPTPAQLAALVAYFQTLHGD